MARYTVSLAVRSFLSSAVLFCGIACSGPFTASADRRDIRAEFLLLKASDPSPEREAKLDRLLHDYFQNVVVEPAKRGKVSGIVTDQDGKPLHDVTMIAKFQRQRSPFNPIETAKEATTLLVDGEFTVDWHGFDGVTLEFTDHAFYRVKSGFWNERPAYDKVGLEPGHEWNERRSQGMEKSLERGEVLPLPSDLSKIQIVVRKFAWELTDHSGLQGTAPPPGATTLPVETPIRPGLVLARTTEPKVVLAPVDGKYAVRTSLGGDIMSAYLNRGDPLGFYRRPNGVVTTCGGGFEGVRDGEVWEWYLIAVKPNIPQATTHPAGE